MKTIQNLNLKITLCKKFYLMFFFSYKILRLRKNRNEEIGLAQKTECDDPKPDQ